MKKLTRKLFISVMTLVLTAMALGTSTFAWFSMNTTATATGMQVNAKSNARYLLIGDVNDAEAIQGVAQPQISVAASYRDTANTEKKVYPCAYTATGIITTNAETNETVTHIAAGNWYTASNGSSTSATGSVSNYKLVTLGADDYMLEYKVWLVLSADSEAFNGQVKVTYTNTAGDAAVSACVVIGSENLLVGSGHTEETTTENVAIANNTCTEVTIYIYLDGNSTNINSAYFNEHNGITGTCSITFDLVV